MRDCVTFDDHSIGSATFPRRRWGIQADGQGGARTLYGDDRFYLVS